MLAQLCSAHMIVQSLHYLSSTTRKFGSLVDVVLNYQVVGVNCTASKAARHEVSKKSDCCAVITDLCFDSFLALTKYI